MRKRPVLLCTAALLSLALTGCSGGDDAESASDSSTSSAPETTSTPSATSSTTPSAEASEEATAPVEPAPAAPTAAEAPVDAPAEADAASSSGMSAEAQAFFDAGGACNSDTFPTGAPSPELMAELQTICAAQAGDQPGYAGPGSIDNYPMYPDTTDQTDYATDDGSGYQRPEADADGYVGPSEEYYGYNGYVEPGFEYQVGSECFDADLGRCKTSGELQLEYMEGAEVEELMQEQGIPLPSEQ
ncbi:UNVERIFIED_CONTAM: hypothetical protein RF649_13495 [Kocuria sp. CPCC 205295]|uniref:hypothetical protein n=1 Tax=Kocuria sp. CPCC 205295 TaxID=3073557 RepID=UPI0036DA4125